MAIITRASGGATSINPRTETVPPTKLPTAAIISAELGVGPVVLEQDLRERDAGEWSGLGSFVRGETPCRV